MSQWATLSTKIKHNRLGIFEEVCTKHDLHFNRSSLRIEDSITGGHFMLQTADQDTYSIYCDTDIRYNSIARRLPNGMDSITRDYSEAVVAHDFQNIGGAVVDRVENEDGSLTLSLAVGY